jgi:spore coat polysaccharide biosynthesis protein SpsF
MIIPGFITVRSTSSRLPKKCFLPFGENMNVLQHIIRRAIHYDIDPIVCTSTDPSDDAIETLAKKEGVKIFRGSLVNKLQRWADCAKHFDLTAFHTVDADDPFFDGKEMHRSMRLMNEGGYDIVCPTHSSSSGGASVGYSLTSDIVKKAVNDLSKGTDTEMMWYYIEKIEGRKTVILTENAEQPLTIRLTLDYEEDYWLLRTVQRLVGNVALRSEVDELFRRNPDLYKVNWFHNEEWEAAQKAKKI